MMSSKNLKTSIYKYPFPTSQSGGDSFRSPRLEGFPHFNSHLNFNPPVPPNLEHLHEERVCSLLKFLGNQGSWPSPADEIKRRDAITKLKQIIMEWIVKVASSRGFTNDQIIKSSATIKPYGSYGLAVHGADSDIDALCIGPSFVTMAEDFFILLRDMLESNSEISELHCLKDAKIPLMRFKFDGISIDLPYARLPIPSVPDNVDVFDQSFSKKIDETSWKCLSGLRANIRILRLVPHFKKFQLMLRCLKLWARRRGVYCNLVGFLGGIHMAVLTAYVCQRYPSPGVIASISIFFETFACWNWSKPVMLEGPFPPANIKPRWMSIQFPCGTRQFCRSNMTNSTFHKIKTEFIRGRTVTKNILGPDFNWSSLFEPFPYTERYKRFMRIFLAASSQEQLRDWVGWVKSRFRSLILMLEESGVMCDPNPTEFIDQQEARPNTVFCWGLTFGRKFTNTEEVEKSFRTSIASGYDGYCGTLELSIVDSSQLPKEDQPNNNQSQLPEEVALSDHETRTETEVHTDPLDISNPQNPINSRHMPHGGASTEPASERTRVVGV